MSGEIQSAKTIFGKALEIDSAEELSAYLDHACGENSQIRGEVEDLLQAISQAGGFMARPVLGPKATVDLPMTEKPGTLIGSYKLIEQIGEGGMGVVYMAEQKEPVRRTVALKIIKPGMDTKDVVARFEAERQALALMSHPNVAKVLDAGGTDSGRPYFVMELVRGISITDFCDQRKLDPRQRLELFVTVSQAVQHAHQKGIIHRDLKPSNILVELHDVIAVPKVIDFGVAKATTHQLTERSLHTGFAQMIGTPLYMSPEQAELSGLDVDTRTDIYSLGVLLYELLSGTTPFASETFKQAGYDEMRRIIREDVPPRPSERISTLAAESVSTVSEHRGTDPRRLCQTMRGELDWIVMKALEKDRTRRYETASALAADIQHYLDDEPVVACPPSVAYWFGKFARRNKVALLMASLVSVALLVGAVGLAMSNILISQERDAVTAQRLEAEKQKKVAEENFRLARNAVDDMYTQVAQQWLEDQPHMTQVQRDFLTKAAEFYERLPSHRRDDRELQFEAASAQLRVGKIRFHLGQYDQAARQLEKSVVLLGQLFRDDPGDPECARSLAQAIGSQGNVLKAQGKLDPAIEAYTRSIEIFSEIAVANPEDGDAQRELITTKISLGQASAKAGKRDEAIQLLREVVKASTKLAGQFPDDLKTKQCVIRAMSVLAAIVSDNAESESLLRQSIQLGEKLTGAYPNNPNVQHRLSRSHSEFAYVMVRAGRVDEAVKSLRKSVQGFTGLAENYPDVFIYRMDRIADSMNLSSVLYGDGRSDEAENTARCAVAEARLLLEAFPENVSCRKRLIGALILHGWILERIGRDSDSPQPLQEAVAQCHELADLVANEEEPKVNLGPLGCPQERVLTGYMLPRQLGNLDLLPCKDLLMLAYSRLFFLSCEDDLDKSLEYLNNIIAITGETAGALGNKASLYRVHGKYDESVRTYKRALELFPEHAKLHKDLGISHFFQGEYKAAAEAWSRYIERQSQDPLSFGNRSAAYVHLGRYEEALTDLNQALQLAPKHPNVNVGLAWLLVAGPAAIQDPERALVIARDLIPWEEKSILGAAYYRVGKYEEAKKALLMMHKTEDPQKIKYIKSIDFRRKELFFLSMIYRKLGQHEEAQRWFNEAVEWKQENTSPEDVSLQRIRDEAAAVLASYAQLISPRDNGPLNLDPRGDRLFVGNQPSSLQISLFSDETNTAGSTGHDFQIIHDGHTLRSELDYRVRHEEATRTLEIQSTAGVFAPGTYKLSIRSATKEEETPGSETVIVISPGLARPRQLTFPKAGDGNGSLACGFQQPLTLVRKGATWRYLDDGSDQGVAWRETGFEDSEWKTGPAQLGYGDGDETTTIDFGPDSNNKYPTSYFRHTFQVAEW